MAKRDVKTSEKFDFSEKYIKWFSELGKGDIKIAGGKGANLGEMFKDFPVPPGFVITSGAFELFVREIKEEIKNIVIGIDYEDTAELEKKAKEIRDLIEKQEIPAELKNEILEAYHILGSEKIDEKRISEDALNILKNSKEPVFVAVRSSATTEDLSSASFAGQQESFLNIKGESNLIKHIKKCFASLYTARALYYRHKKGFSEEQALLAVIVQKMIDSEKSGVVFSKDPITLEGQVVIEAVFGLGEGVVSGKIQPDYYIIKGLEPEDLKIKNIKVADKKIAVVRTGGGENKIVGLSSEKSKEQVLSRGQILEIANYALRLEEHYGKPQDIEFGVEAGKVYILQSRPVTTKEPEKKQGSLSGNIILEGLGASPGVGVGSVKLIKERKDLAKIKKGDVLVTEMTNPDMVVSMQKCSAIVTDEGGMTAHASIVSREMGIPAVVGTGEATSVLKEGMRITVDGSNGKIYEGQVSETRFAEVKPVIETKIKIKLILDLPDFAERAAESKIDSIGLLRLEGIIAGSGKHPLFYEKENRLEEYMRLLKKGIEKIAKYFNSIWIRSSDLRSDEYSSLQGAPEKEINPMLGLHGIRFSLEHPKIFEAELKAVRQVAKENPEKEFGIMFPQVISVEEIKKAKEIFNRFKVSNIKVGAMVETPAAVQIIEDLCGEIDFISFGTNDLTQYTLAVDRGEDSVQELYNEIHPAVLSQIKKVLEACRRNRVESSICGQAGSNRKMVEFLIRNRISSISVNADAAREISVFVRGIEEAGQAQKEEIFDKRKQEGMIKKEELAEKKEGNFKNPRNTICANCGKKTWLPFKPRGKGPFYCRKCHFKKKTKEKESKMPKLPEIRDKDNQNKIFDMKEIGERKERLREFGVKGGADTLAYEEHIGPISPIDSKDRIKGKAEDIKKEIEEKKQEKIKKAQEIEEGIKITEEWEGQEKEEGISSEPVNPEEIGVYNPDEEPDNLPQKMKYRFDEGDEEVYSDVF